MIKIKICQNKFVMMSNKTIVNIPWEKKKDFNPEKEKDRIS